MAKKLDPDAVGCAGVLFVFLGSAGGTGVSMLASLSLWQTAGAVLLGAVLGSFLFFLLLMLRGMRGS